MSAVSGRAGLFSMDAGPFFNDLRGTPYTADRRQKSGALRLEFGKQLIPTAATTTASVRMTINTGIMAIATPGKVPTITAYASGGWATATSGFLSGYLHINITATGQFSGQHSGMDINYMAIGY